MRELFLQHFYKIYDYLPGLDDIYIAQAYFARVTSRVNEISKRKGDIMQTNISRRRLSIFTILVLLAALVASTAAASSSSRSVVIQIPFDFIIAGKTLPAGQYIVTRSTVASSEGLSLKGIDRDTGVFVLTATLNSNEKQRDSKLVFHRYHDQYFLSEFWVVGEASGRGVIKSERERTLERELAKAGSKAERIAIIAQQK